MFFLIVTKDDDVIQVSYGKSVEPFQDFINECLKVSWDLCQTKRYHVELIFTKWCYKCCFSIGALTQLYVVVSTS